MERLTVVQPRVAEGNIELRRGELTAMTVASMLVAVDRFITERRALRAA